jgi:hypothetical protein
MTGSLGRWIRLASAIALGALQTGSVLAQPDDLVQVELSKAVWPA